MTHFRPTLIPRSPFADLVASPEAARGGLVVGSRTELGLATVIARKGKSAELAQRVRERWDLELPRGPRRASVGDLAVVGVAPDAWLAMHERGRNHLAESLREVTSEIASVSDQSDGYAVLRLSGPKVRETLAKMIPVDLNHGAFKPGYVAVTAAGHIGVTLWRIDDGQNVPPVLEVAVFRSMAADFWRFLCDSAAEFGMVDARRSLPLSLAIL